MQKAICKIIEWVWRRRPWVNVLKSAVWPLFKQQRCFSGHAASSASVRTASIARVWASRSTACLWHGVWKQKTHINNHPSETHHSITHIINNSHERVDGADAVARLHLIFSHFQQSLERKLLSRFNATFGCDAWKSKPKLLFVFITFLHSFLHSV